MITTVPVPTQLCEPAVEGFFLSFLYGIGTVYGAELRRFYIDRDGTEASGMCCCSCTSNTITTDQGAFFTQGHML